MVEAFAEWMRPGGRRHAAPYKQQSRIQMRWRATSMSSLWVPSVGDGSRWRLSHRCGLDEQKMSSVHSDARPAPTPSQAKKKSEGCRRPRSNPTHQQKCELFARALRLQRSEILQHFRTVLARLHVQVFLH